MAQKGCVSDTHDACNHEPMCVYHKSEYIRFYCEECRVFICDDCISGKGKHRRCFKTKLSDYGNRSRRLLRERTKRAEDKLSKLSSELDLTMQVQKRFNEAVDESINSVVFRREIIRQKFDDLQKQLISKLDGLRNQANAQYEEFIKLHTNKYCKMQEITETIRTTETDMTEENMMIYTSKLNKYIDSSEVVPKLEPPSYVTDDKYFSLKYLQQLFGDIEFVEFNYLPIATY
ncbi:uncharacterized protein LOC134721322 isoform X1 [Mytilus trossulus]|uniref:uncharacterized protein LOC134721322 isoform X1 n=2 Tax=Mytilus trossulus TaxID=6551 RepID=UPI003006A9F8